MQTFYFVVMKTYCLRRHEELILLHHPVPPFVGLWVLFPGPTPFRGGQLPCSLFPADSWAWPAQASTALPLPATPSPPLGIFMWPWTVGVPRKFCACPMPETPLFPCHHPWADPNCPHVPSPDPSRWVPFRMPLSVLPP